MEDDRLSGARNGVETMLFYMFIEAFDKYEDPKQYIATEMVKMIELSEEQAMYVKSAIATDNKVFESLSSSIELLKNMRKQNTIDIDSMNIVIDILSNIYTRFKDALKKFNPSEEDIVNE